MADLINRQAAIDAVQQHREGVLGGYEYDEGVAFVYAAAHNHIIDVIKHLPSADVQPARHGRWSHDGSRWKNRYICSECGYRWFFDTIKGMYCPNCGARMDGEQND